MEMDIDSGRGRLKIKPAVPCKYRFAAWVKQATADFFGVSPKGTMPKSISACSGRMGGGAGAA